MKKVILSIAVLSGLALGASAQTEKGKVILGGAASYESVKSDADGAKASENLSIVPNVGFFVANNVAIGTGIGYEYSKTATANPFGFNEAFVVSPFGRYYQDLGGSFKFFGQLSVPLAFGSVKGVDANGETGDKVGSSNSIGVAVSPGFAFFPTRKIGIEFALRGISYESYRVKDGNDNDLEGAGYDRFSVGTSFFTPQIGVQFHF
jgi:hypothetical protein